jgi:7-carboxy-7-deazaguanine synthase
MFGQNKVSGSFNESGASLLVNEVFYTIQGEGPDSGRTAIFVRLSKCNLRCYFCDTEFEKGVERDLQNLVDEVLLIARSNGCKLVVITGGEPLLQNIVPFVRAMNSYDISCSIETAGTVMLPRLHEWFDPLRSINGNLIVCSPKTPKIHPDMERLVGAWKYVVRNGEGDKWGMPTKSTQNEGRSVTGARAVFYPKHPVVQIWVSPMDEQSETHNKLNRDWARDLCLRYGYRLSLQIHKLVNVP